MMSSNHFDQPLHSLVEGWWIPPLLLLHSVMMFKLPLLLLLAIMSSFDNRPVVHLDLVVPHLSPR